MSAPSLVIGRRHLLLAGAAAFALAGCATGGRQTQIYVLRPDIPNNPPGQKVSWDLAVGMPYAAGSLNSDRIALTRTSETLDFFADSAWTDQLPVLLQNSLIESFEKSGRIKSVSRETAGLQADYVLETEVRDFAARYSSPDGPPEVVVRIMAKMVKLPDRAIVSTFVSRQSSAAAENRVPAVVIAFNAALTASLREIVEWALNAPGAKPAAPATPARRRRRRRRRANA
jgi:cholesterol transport system auxiliary component